MNKTVKLNKKISKVFFRKADDEKFVKIIIDNYYVELPYIKSCCEHKELFLNGRKFNKEKCLHVEETDTVTFEFTEKYLKKKNPDDIHYKTSICIILNGNNRIRLNSIYYSSKYGMFGAGIYTVPIYLCNLNNDDHELLCIV